MFNPVLKFLTATEIIMDEILPENPSLGVVFSGFMIFLCGAFGIQLIQGVFYIFTYDYNSIPWFALIVLPFIATVYYCFVLFLAKVCIKIRDDK